MFIDNMPAQLKERTIPVEELVEQIDRTSFGEPEVISIGRVVPLIYVPTDAEVRALVSSSHKAGDGGERTFVTGNYSCGPGYFLSIPTIELDKGTECSVMGIRAHFDKDPETGDITKLYMGASSLNPTSYGSIESLLRNPNIRVVE